jgi:hypothetical protein
LETQCFFLPFVRYLTLQRIKPEHSYVGKHLHKRHEKCARCSNARPILGKRGKRKRGVAASTAPYCILYIFYTPELKRRDTSQTKALKNLSGFARHHWRDNPTQRHGFGARLAACKAQRKRRKEAGYNIAPIIFKGYKSYTKEALFSAVLVFLASLVFFPFICRIILPCEWINQITAV